MARSRRTRLVCHERARLVDVALPLRVGRERLAYIRPRRQAGEGIEVRDAVVHPAGVAHEEAARSAIMDLDVAAEMSRLVSGQVLRDLGVSMIAQANRMPQSLMKLFE